MKYLVTEDQLNRVSSDGTRLWIRRNFDLVEKAFYETQHSAKSPCDYDKFEDYLKLFITYMIDDLHPSFYRIVGQGGLEYDSLINELTALYRDAIFDHYTILRRDC